MDMKKILYDGNEKLLDRIVLEPIDRFGIKGYSVNKMFKRHFNFNRKC